MKQRWFLIWCALILIGGFGLQLAFIEKTPWDWDEPVYTLIAQLTQILGYPSSPINAASGETGWYPYHPPFHFYLMANWFDLIGRNDIVAGRVLSVIMASALRLVLMMIAWVVYKSKAHVLLTGVLANTDGWLLYTTSLVKLDTTAVLIGAIGALGFLLCLQRESLKWAVQSGLNIGLAVIYKHVALIYILVIVLHRLLTRRGRHHLLVVVLALCVLAIYVVVMIVTVKDPYVDATFVQVMRSLGQYEARGLDYGIGVAIQALAQTYVAFLGTLLVLGVTVPLALWLGWRSLRGRMDDSSLSVLVAWTIAATGFLAAVRLRNPGYLIFLIAPAQVLLPALLHPLMVNPRKWVARAGWGLLALILALNVVTLVIRYTRFGATNAFQQVQQVMAELPVDMVVLSEEPVCAFARPGQKCLKLGSYQSAEQLAAAQPDIIILYRTTTHSPPDSPALQELIANSVPLPGVTPVEGWKEEFTFLLVDPLQIYRFDP